MPNRRMHLQTEKRLESGRMMICAQTVSLILKLMTLYLYVCKRLKECPVGGLTAEFVGGVSCAPLNPDNL